VVETKKYIRKPLIVDAVLVTEENFAACALWCRGQIRNNDGTEPKGPLQPKSQHIQVRHVSNPKSQRQTRAYVGDWILSSDVGYKIYLQKAFENSFEPLQGEDKDRATQEEKNRQVQEAERSQWSQAEKSATTTPVGEES
jgi:hypothetical protein